MTVSTATRATSASSPAQGIFIELNRYVGIEEEFEPVAGPDTNLIETCLSEDNPGFITVVAIAELVRVLERAYRFAPLSIAASIERILQIDVFVVENEQEVFAGMTALKKGQGSFADALIHALGKKAGCTTMVTFDRKALRMPGYAAVL
jgi:predicted nucleic-acid-binding protein